MCKCLIQTSSSSGSVYTAIPWTGHVCGKKRWPALGTEPDYTVLELGQLRSGPRALHQEQDLQGTELGGLTHTSVNYTNMNLFFFNAISSSISSLIFRNIKKIYLKLLRCIETPVTFRVSQSIISSRSWSPNSNKVHNCSLSESTIPHIWLSHSSSFLTRQWWQDLQRISCTVRAQYFSWNIYHLYKWICFLNLYHLLVRSKDVGKRRFLNANRTIQHRQITFSVMVGLFLYSRYFT